MARTKKTDEEAVRSDRGGKIKHQKLKPYLVLDYLLRKTDEKHHVTIEDIVHYLENDCGMKADPRSVRDDINEINIAVYLLDNGCTLECALEEYKDYKYIQCSENHREYFVKNRRNEFTENDARILAEIVYSARFLSKREAMELVKVLSKYTSDYAAAKILHEVPQLDRPRTNKTGIYQNLSKINEAMNQGTKASPHTPEKITFKYQKININNVDMTVDRHGGAVYKVSPYLLILNDENYYLRAFDDRSQEMRTYRVDRMKDVTLTGEARDGEDCFDESEIQSFPQRVFGMFTGKPERVTLRFEMILLDAAVERFGRKGLEYIQVDEEHFTVSPEVEISDHFFAWICRFGTKVKILGPETVIEGYKKHLQGICSQY